MSADYAECRRMVEVDDPDRAIALAFAPPGKQDALAALYAFDIETGTVRDKISEPMPGEIRLQWWRDILSGPGEGAAGHPVAAAIAEVIEAHELPRGAFDRLLEARIFDLYDDPMPDRATFEGYAGETLASINVLAARILDPKSADGLGEAAGHAGVAETVAMALRRLPLHRRRGQTYFPGDLLAAVGCSPEDLVKGDPAPAGRAVEAMAAFGREHAASFADHLPSVPRSVRAAFIPAGFSDGLCKRAARAGPAALDEPISLGPIRRSFRAWRVMRT